MKRLKQFIAILILCLSVSVINAAAQTTEFTYQGSLKDGANLANGNYDFEFALFDSPAGGTQLGSTLTRNAVAVSAGIFSVNLDFGGQFPGANRYLEIRVRLTGQPGITTLAPRQLVNSAPYSVQSLNAANAALATNATQLGGVAANQYVITTDPRMTDARDPLPGSVRYVQNGTTQQPASSFNITGDGTVGGNLSVGGSFSLNIVNADTQYNIAGSRVLTASSFFSNIFAGIGAGAANSSGSSNSFFGHSSGNSNTGAGGNSFFGEQSGFGTSTGGQNSFFGQLSGRNNITGSGNSFFGRYAGLGNTTGVSNSFFGRNAGISNTTGDNNTIIGIDANVGSGNLTFATAIGSGAVVSTSNYIQLGRTNGSDDVRVSGNLVLITLGGAGGTDVCRNVANQISTCSSSLRYKTDVQTFTGGLEVVQRLRPITFNWKDGGMHDVGFAAEEVEQIEPLLTTYNKDGQIEGVKYGQITTVLVNAVKEQQAQIESQKVRLDSQQTRINDLQEQVRILRALICEQNKGTAACGPTP